MPDLDLGRRIVLPVEGRDAVSRRRLVYKTDGSTQLAMDVYGPADRPTQATLPAMLFVHGGPIPREMRPPAEWGMFTDYPTSQADMQAALDYLRRHADDLGIDADRIGVWVFSGGGPLLAWCLRDRPAFVRCLLASYALLDVRHLLPPDADAERVARAHAFSPAAHLGAAAETLPIFVARAGRDSAIFNTSIDEFVREALAANASLDFANHASGQHGFDILDDDERSREIIGRAIMFARSRLLG